LPEQYILTVKGRDELIEAIKGAELELSNLGLDKGDAAAKQDGWHGEEFKLASQKEQVSSKRLAELESILKFARVVTPVQQDQAVRIGNGILLLYQEGGIKKKLILDGFRIKSIPNLISVQGPLGKGLLGAKVNEVRKIPLPESTVVVKVLEIVLPSEAEQFLNEQSVF